MTSTARSSGVTYASSVCVDIEQRTLKMPPPGSNEAATLVGRVKRYVQRPLCRMPIMVGSTACSLRQSADSESSREESARGGGALRLTQFPAVFEIIVQSVNVPLPSVSM